MKNIILLLMCPLSLVCCVQQSGTPNYMAFNDVRYIDEFPKTYTADVAEAVDLGLIGTQDFAIHDSLMIVSTTNKNGFLSFFTLHDYKPLGSYILAGNGPQEFYMAPWVNQCPLYSENGDLYMTLFNQARNRLHKMNVSESIRTNKLSMFCLRDSLSLPLFSFVFINDSTYLCREITSDETQQIRYFLKNGKKEVPSHFAVLNEARVRQGSDNYNLLSSIIKCNVDREMIVEIPVGLNTINLYAFDGSFTRTICAGKKIDNIDDLQDKEKWDRLYTYANLRVYPDFFGALYIGETQKSFELDRKKTPIIQFYNWEGEPLAELKISHYATSFDLDFVNGYLYTLDHRTEEFYKYKIGDLFSQLVSQPIKYSLP